MKKEKQTPLIFFNASVIIAGLISPSGGSGRLLRDAEEKQVTGVISEIILDEVLRHWDKIGKSKSRIEQTVKRIFPKMHPIPKETTIEKYNGKTLDLGDAHVLASSDDSRCDYLVTLDKKHLLAIAGKIKKFKIVSPGQLISLLLL